VDALGVRRFRARLLGNRRHPCSRELARAVCRGVGLWTGGNVSKHQATRLPFSGDYVRRFRVARLIHVLGFERAINARFVEPRSSFPSGRAGKTGFGAKAFWPFKPNETGARRKHVWRNVADRDATGNRHASARGCLQRAQKKTREREGASPAGREAWRCFRCSGCRVVADVIGISIPDQAASGWVLR
jgi:hypothetical protein